MNGYELIKKMRKVRRREHLTAIEQALFHELVAVCNDSLWGDVFECSNVELCYALNINEKTLKKARESLINVGLLYYRAGKSRRCISEYSFVPISIKTTSNISNMSIFEQSTTVNNTVENAKTTVNNTVVENPTTVNNTVENAKTTVNNTVDTLYINKTKHIDISLSEFDGKNFEAEIGKSKIEKTSEFDFEKVWILYEKKGNKKTSENLWNSLNENLKELILKHIPLYVKSTPEKQFRKNFETYIRQEAWNDEIIEPEKIKTSNHKTKLNVNSEWEE